MIGYHYTSKKNWLKIQKEGLKKYPIKKDELKPYFPDELKAIFCWKGKLGKVSHAGTVLFQVGTKGETEIVQLEIEFNEDDILKSKDGRRVVLFHDGHVGKWNYHKNDEAFLLTKDLEPKDIKLVEEYDIINLLKEKI